MAGAVSFLYVPINALFGMETPSDKPLASDALQNLSDVPQDGKIEWKTL